MFLFNLTILTTVKLSKIVLIFAKHLKILTNTISRFRFGDSKPIVTSPSAQ